MQGIAGLRKQTFEDPKVAKVLFGNPLMGFAWFFLRVFLGWQWLSSGWGKVYGDTAIGWTKDGVNAQGKFVNAGDSILGFWNRAAAIPQQGTPPVRYDWYRDFLQYMIDQRWNGWFTYVIAYGEVIVGVALILGAFTGISALFGATMNLNFMLAGTASTNPVLFTAAIFLVLGWKVAGYVGLDRYLLPALGTPWQAGQLFHGLRPRQPSVTAATLAGGAAGD